MSGIVVRPVRFTDDLPAMQRFLQVVGLRPRLVAESGSWVDMVADGGMVGVHDAATADSGAKAGETHLGFEADDITALAGELRAAGVADVVIHDESYGQVLTCTDPLGDTIAIDGRPDDLYGYRVLSGDAPVPGLRVVPVRFTDPTGPLGAWLEALRLTPDPSGDDSYRRYAAGDGAHGFVGLHHVYSDDLPVVRGPAAVHLTFATTESLDAVASRLHGAGYTDAVVTREDFGAMLTVTDPDGREGQVHELAQGLQ
jgi:hypothetical protein